MVPLPASVDVPTIQRTSAGRVPESRGRASTVLVAVVVVVGVMIGAAVGEGAGVGVRVAVCVRGMVDWVGVCV